MGACWRQVAVVVGRHDFLNRRHCDVYRLCQGRGGLAVMLSAVLVPVAVNCIIPFVANGSGVPTASGRF